MLGRFYRELEPVFFGRAPSASIDSSSSDNISQSNKLTMTKVIDNDSSRAELAVTTKKEQEEKNSKNLWENYGYFGFQACDFSIEKTNLPENTIFYVNQGQLSYKDSKKIYYNDIFIIGQITPLLNQPENISEYAPKENEVKILRSKYHISTGAFLGLEYCLAYWTVQNDPEEQLFDYGYTKVVFCTVLKK